MEKHAKVACLATSFWQKVFGLWTIEREDHFLLPEIIGHKHKTPLQVHIMYMGERQYEDPASVRKLHHKMLSTLLGSKEAARSSILYSYKHGFSGFAARLTKSQAEKIAEFPGVVQVFPNGIQKFHTTRSWDFLGLNHYS